FIRAQAGGYQELETTKYVTEVDNRVTLNLQNDTAFNVVHSAFKPVNSAYFIGQDEAALLDELATKLDASYFLFYELTSRGSDLAPRLRVQLVDQKRQKATSIVEEPLETGVNRHKSIEHLSAALLAQFDKNGAIVPSKSEKRVAEST